MKLEEELCLKFPAILQKKLLSGEIELPDATQFDYSPIKTYRAVERKKEDMREISTNDFKSYFELGKAPKCVRGLQEDLTKDPHYYGVSSFLKKEIVEQKMKFPNPHKKMAVGYVYCEGGPQHTNDQHVCWWLYDGIIIKGFNLSEE